MNIQTLLVILKKFLKEVAYLYKLMEVAGLHKTKTFTDSYWSTRIFKN